MMFHKLITFSLLGALALGCGGDQKDVNNFFRLDVTSSDKKIQYGDTISIVLQNKRDLPVDSVVYMFNDQRVDPVDGSLIMTPEKLGHQMLKASVYAEGQKMDILSTVLVLAPAPPQLFTYEIVNTFPHDINAFTQGLEFYNDTLYEGTGRNGSSSLRKLDLTTGEVLQKADLEQRYFGEGITILNDKIYQLTWKARTGFIYELNNMEVTGTFNYGSQKEGWGLTNNGEVIFMSDGTDKIWILDPETMQEKGYIQTVTNSSVFNKANELEYVDGKIYANVWLKDSAMIIDARSGAITGVIDFRGLKNKVTKHDDLDVLNGIAYHKQRGTFFVTGKNWDKMFEVRIVPKD